MAGQISRGRERVAAQSPRRDALFEHDLLQHRALISTLYMLSIRSIESVDNLSPPINGFSVKP